MKGRKGTRFFFALGELLLELLLSAICIAIGAGIAYLFGQHPLFDDWELLLLLGSLILIAIGILLYFLIYRKKK